jgi:alpha-aminoadipic semialdehyde synthase
VIKAGDGHLLESNMDRYFEWLSVFVNCIVWTKTSPRLLTNAYLKKVFDDHRHDSNRVLPVIGDIACDPNGAVQACRDTYPDHPVYMWTPESTEEPILSEFDVKNAGHRFRFFDLSKYGYAIMAVTNLPCEFPREASIDFSRALCQKRGELGGKSYVECLAEADFSGSLQDSGLMQPFQDAVILFNGEFNDSSSHIKYKDLCVSMIEAGLIHPKDILPLAG